MDTLQKIKDLHNQVKELEERRQATDSKSEDKKLQDIICALKSDIESLAGDVVEKLVPENISITIQVEKKVKIETDYYDFESIAYDIAEYPDIYESEEVIRKAMLNRFRDRLDIYDFIDLEDIKLKYD